MKKYLIENWDGWPLHSLLAGLFFWAMASLDPFTVLLVLNTVFWPNREADQHKGYWNIWTFHRVMEWGCPVLVGFVCWALLTPYFNSAF